MAREWRQGTERIKDFVFYPKNNGTPLMSFKQESWSSHFLKCMICCTLKYPFFLMEIFALTKAKYDVVCTKEVGVEMKRHESW